jgi:hypothetical protein
LNAFRRGDETCWTDAGCIEEIAIVGAVLCGNGGDGGDGEESEKGDGEQHDGVLCADLRRWRSLGPYLIFDVGSSEPLRPVRRTLPFVLVYGSR